MASLILYRTANSGDTETTSGIQKIDTDDVQSYNISLARRRTDNPQPFANSLQKPDTGSSGILVTVNLLFAEESSVNTNVAILRNWAIQDNRIKTTFPFGRIGMVSTKRSEFTLRPNTQAGYKIIDVDITTDFDAQGRTKISVQLEFAGDPARLGQ